MLCVQTILDSVVISGSIGDGASSLCEDKRDNGGVGRRRWTTQEIDNHRTFNYFLNAAVPGIKSSGRERAWILLTWQMNSPCLLSRGIIRTVRNPRQEKIIYVIKYYFIVNLFLYTKKKDKIHIKRLN